MTADYHQNEFSQFWIRNGILFFEYKPDVSIDLAAARLIVADRIRFQNNSYYPVLCDTRGIAFIDKGGRDYLAQSGSVMTKAVALLYSGPVSLTLSTFYLEVNKHRVPSAIFTDTGGALGFLGGYV